MSTLEEEEFEEALHIIKTIMVAKQQLLELVLLLEKFIDKSDDKEEPEPPFWRHQMRDMNCFHQIQKNDRSCRELTRLDKSTFNKLCSLLTTRGDLRPTKYVGVNEMVAMFLYICAHDVKNRIVRTQWARSEETVSRHFGEVLTAILQCHDVLLKKPTPITSECTDNQWKWFQNCLGALDGTYIEVKVREEDKARYRTRKGTIATNVLGVCFPEGEFIFISAGFEGSAADSRVLRESLAQPNGLKVPRGFYYLCDAGYANAEGFLAPYRGERYHLSDWRGAANAPRTARELFNRRHSSARNVIERVFGALKMTWAILRRKSYYPVQTQAKLVLALGYVNNLIVREMGIRSFDEFYDPETVSTGSQGENIEVDNIEYVEQSNEWTTFREMVASHMIATW